jgi:hypothetical protein
MTFLSSQKLSVSLGFGCRDMRDIVAAVPVRALSSGGRGADTWFF